MKKKWIFLAFFIVLLIAGGLYAAFHQGKTLRFMAWFRGNNAPIVYAEGERLQNIPVYIPKGDTRGLVILISDKGGETDRLNALRANLLDNHLIVASVDFDKWVEELNEEDGECAYLVSDLEALAKDTLRRLDLDVYYHPVIVGIGQGGTLAYASASDSPVDTLAGAVALEPAVAAETRLPSCVEEAEAIASPTGGFSYGVNVKIPVPSILISASGVQNNAKEAIDNKIAILSVSDDPDARMKIAVKTAAGYAMKDSDSAKLPLVDMPPKGEPRGLVIFISGDGGWRDIDMEIGEWLQKRGLRIIGVDTLRYFWNEHPPEEVAVDIEAILKKENPDHKLPVSLFGYSFGSDVIPFVWPHLDDDAQNDIKLIALMSLSKTADFKVSIDGWLGGEGEHKTLPLSEKLPFDKTLCIYGAEDEDTSCTAPSLSGMDIIRREGGHHFDEDYKAVAEIIYKKMQEKGALLSPFVKEP